MTNSADQNSSARRLVYCRDVESHVRLGDAAEVEADLIGLVTRSRSHGRIHFLLLRDVTGVVQLIAKRGDLTKDEWALVTSLKAGMRISVSGKVGKSERGLPSVFLNKAPVVRDSTLESPISNAELDYARVGNQIFIARLRNRASAFLRDKGYLEIEPKYISAQWSSQGVEPLEVVYPGFGASAYLAPTPATQLINALIATGTGKVFAQSRCFSTTYRDERSSAESLIICAKAIALPPREHYELLCQCLAYTFGEPETLPEAGLFPVSEWSQRCIDRKLSEHKGEDVKVPTLEVYRSPGIPKSSEGIQVDEVCRLVWPARRTIAEASQEKLDRGLSIASTTIHIERMASLLEDVPVRQIRNLGVGIS